jgi:3-oxoacyl-[acyl-carrier protein] reductase
MCSTGSNPAGGPVGRTLGIIGVRGPCGTTGTRSDPDQIATELFNKANDPERIKHIVGSVPVRRIGQPQDIAYTTGFFLDARAGFINGQGLYVCGGPTVGLVPA